MGGWAFSGVEMADFTQREGGGSEFIYGRPAAAEFFLAA